jgi:hypothetical protein
MIMLLVLIKVKPIPIKGFKVKPVPIKSRAFNTMGFTLK